MLSLIICTYNRGERLAATLESLRGQTLPTSEWELVVIDNNSTDNTAEVVRRFAQLNPKYVLETQQGLSYARNRGIAESVGEWIVMVDDDVLLPSDFLERYSRFFAAHPDAVAVGGRVVPKPEADVPKWMSRYPMMAIGGACDLGEGAQFFPRGRTFIGANHALKRSVIERVGGYNVALGRTGTKLLGGEEKDICNRIAATGYPIYYLHSAWLYHLIPASRMTRSYFAPLCRLIGQSERLRTLAISRGAYNKRLLAEIVKWSGAIILALGFLLRSAPSKGGYLLLMRWEIAKGLCKNSEP